MMKGCQLILEALLSSSVKSLQLEFKCNGSNLFRLYFDIIASKADKMTSLSLLTSGVIRVSREDGVKGLGPLHPSLEYIGRLVCLESLIIDPWLVDFDLLDTLGDLPRLKSLKIFNACYKGRRVRTLDLTSSKSHRDGRFGSLERLEIRASIPSLTAILQAFFLDVLGRLQLLGCIFDDDEPIFLDFLKCVTHLPTSLQIGFQNGEARSSPRPLDLSALSNMIGDCSLSQLDITHADFIYHPDHRELEKIICLWTNIRHLTLRKWGCVTYHRKTPDDLLAYNGDRFDFTCLAIFAKNMPKLTFLSITILACNTEEVQNQIGSLVPFGDLQYLTFNHSSFINRGIRGFDERVAANYISALIPRKSDVNIKWEKLVMNKANRSSIWDDFIEKHNAFMDSLTGRISEYLNIRKCEYRRVIGTGE